MAGRQSRRQSVRAWCRALVYAVGFLGACLIPFSVLRHAVTNGLSWGDVFMIPFSLLIAGAFFEYVRAAFRDAHSRRVVPIDGVPIKGFETGFAQWRSPRVPTLLLDGMHKLSRRAFEAIDPNRRYRLFVLPASGRCVGAIPLDVADYN